MFKMKFPVNTSWEELISGNYISAVILEMSYNEYFVFGASGMWGKYSANDYKYPLDIIGFKSEFEAVFKHQLKQQKEEQDEILEWLPLEYKELIKQLKSPFRGFLHCINFSGLNKVVNGGK